MSGKSIVWLRPEYEGRESELIHLSAAADLVGVTRSAVSNWAARHGNFPKVVMLAGPRDRRSKWVVKDEFVEFARLQLNKKRGPNKPAAPHRPRVEILRARIAHREAQVERLTELEAKQAQALARTRAALKEHEAGLVEDRRRLEAETDAVAQATDT